METIEIITLSPDQWQAYQHIRLEALKTEPKAFASTYATFVQKPESYWQLRLNQAAEGKSSWLLFARPSAASAAADAPAAADSHQAALSAEAPPALDQLVGIIGAFRIDEEPGVAEIVSVYVTAAWRGKGVGRALMTAIIQTLSQEGSFHTLRLGVSDSQTAAQRLYSSMGFQVKESVQVTLADGLLHQEYIMERPCNFSAAAA